MVTKIGRPELDSLTDRRYVHLIADAWRRDPRLTLLVASHEYLVPEQQQNLYLQLERILERYPDVTIFVEGFAGARRLSRWNVLGSTISSRERREREALARLTVKGTLASDVLARLYPSRAGVIGVDTTDLLAEQREKLKAIDSLIQASLPPDAAVQMPTSEFVEGAFASLFDPIVGVLEDEALNPKLKMLVEARREFYREPQISRYAAVLAELARPEGVDLEAYSSVSAFVGALDMERTLDFEVIEQEREGLIQKLVACSESTITVEREHALREWIEASPVPELAPDVASRWRGQGFPGWMVRLIELSTAYCEQRMPIGQYYARLKGLIDILGIEVPDTSPLARYIRYVTTAEQIDANELMTVEFPALYAELADIFTTSASEHGILALRERANALHRFSVLALPASKVRALLAEDPSYEQWLDDALRLGDSMLPSGWLDQAQRVAAKKVCAILERIVPPLRDYYEAASRRSEQMAERVVHGNDADGGVALWVCGRFHLHQAQQALRRAGDLSWAVLGPQSRIRETSSGMETWTWVYPDSEWSMAETLPDKSSAD